MVSRNPKAKWCPVTLAFKKQKHNQNHKLKTLQRKTASSYMSQVFPGTCGDFKV